jgi:crotonobetainyl-CoA:carnitine CoA-transferase CaiB-like acyl-CoA transferase
MAGGALSGVRVLELGQFLSAPRCARILAEQGAEVIKIEPPFGEALRLLLTMSGAERALAVVNADKKSMTLNLKSERGRELLLKLIATADVVVENYAPGTLKRLGVGVDVMREANPRLIIASISGFGQSGPHSNRLAFDIIAQATSGIMDGLDMRDRPPSVFFADLVSGAYAAMAVGFALYQREKTGEGQHLDISMQDLMYAQHFNAHTHRALGDSESAIAEILGRSLDNLITSATDPLPFWNTYQTTDGHVALVALTDAQWQNLMRAMGREDLVDDDRFDNFVSRVRNAADGMELVRGWTSSRSCDEVVDTLVGHSVPCGKVALRDEVNVDPHLSERGMLATAQHPRLGEIAVPGLAFHTTGAGAPQRAHGDLGEHTDEVLSELLDMNAEQIAALRHEGAL